MSVRAAIEIRNNAACELNGLKRNMERQMKQNQPVLRQHKHRGYEMIVRPSNAVDDNTSQSIKNDFERKCLQVNANKKGAMVQNACTTEAYYVILSLFAKTFLALTIYIGINMQP
jgi:hypothetical protein